MHYAILIYQAEGATDHFSLEEMDAVNTQHRDLQSRAKQAGTFQSAAQLMEGYSASTVKKSGSHISVKDGPYPDSKELLVGFYMLDCENLDAALSFASQIPHAEWGTVEVRAVSYFENLQSIAEN